jgi:hypothetical protein
VVLKLNTEPETVSASKPNFSRHMSSDVLHMLTWSIRFPAPWPRDARVRILDITAPWSELTKVRSTGRRPPTDRHRPPSIIMAPMPETLVPLDEVRKMKRSASSHSIEAKGESGTEDYQIRAFDEATGRTISLWHDVSLVHIDAETQQPTPYLNFVCEIPKFTRYGDSQTSNGKTDDLRRKSYS